MLTSAKDMRGQQGFTLVELAIVLIIVGLLIGGILKGQELILSTRATTTASQSKAIEAAVNSFRDTYNAFPGDMNNVATRLPNCGTAGTACLPGDNNGVLNNVPGVGIAGNEGTYFFGQLAAASLLSGVDPTSTVVGVGGMVMGASMGGSVHYRAGYLSTGAVVGGQMASNTPGTYLVLSGVAFATTTTATNFEGAGIPPKSALKIDSKLDDGAPNVGSVIGLNTTAASATAGCSSGNTTAATYNSRDTDNDCGLAILINQ